jgi:hypothetical protein
LDEIEAAGEKAGGLAFYDRLTFGQRARHPLRDNAV